MTNAEIAAALDELGVLYELDGAVKYRVLAYSDRRQGDPREPGLGRRAGRRGAGDRDPRRRQDAGGEDRRAAGDRRDPRRGEAEGEVPADPDRGDAGPRARGENRAAALRRARHRHAGGPQGGGRGGTDPRASRGSGRRWRRTCWPRWSGSASPGEGPGRLLLSKVRPIAEELAAALREHPAANRVEVAGSVAALGRDLQGHRPDRDRRGAGRARRAPRRPPADRRRRHARAPTACAPRPTTASRSTCGSSPPEAFGNLLQHFTGSQAHNVAAARGGGRPAASRSPSTGSPRPRAARSTLCATEEEVYERLGYAYIEPELREGRGELKAAREGKLPELVELDDIRGDLHSPHDPLRRPQHARGDGRGGARARLRLHGDHRPLGQPRLRRPRHRPSGSGSGSRRSRAWNKGQDAASACSPARRSTSASTARSTTPTTCVDALDWVVASVHTSFSISEAEMTERVLAAIENPQRRLHRPPHRPPDRPPRALRDRRRGGRRGGGAHRHDARDQRQPQPPRPLRAPRPPRREAGVDDRPQHRRPRRRHARQHGLRRRHRPPRLADRRADVANTRGWREFKTLLKRVA